MNYVKGADAMTDLNDDLKKIFANDIFKNLINTDIIKISHLNAVIALLIKSNLDFDLCFKSGTNRNDPEASLTVYLTPNKSINFVFSFDC